MSAPSDEDVSSFMAFTGSSSTESAVAYLEMARGNLETAISLYMDHQAGGTTQSSTGGTNAGLGGSAGITDNPEWLSGTGTGSLQNEVRAPDMAQRMRMVDDDHMMHPMASMLGAASGSLNPFVAEDPGAAIHSMWGAGQAALDGNMDDSEDEENEAVAAAIAISQSRVSADSTTPASENPLLSRNNGTTQNAAAVGSSINAREMINMAANNSNGERFGAEDRKPAAASTGGTTLQDMFAPPNYRYRAGGFQGARNAAKDARRWLVVNIQSHDDFASHALNRDVWGDELVENLIQEGFILWQEQSTAPEGQIYAQRYKVLDYPHIAIIDPRTGRLMWRKEGWTQANPLGAEAFAEIAADFCSRHTFDKPPAAPRPGGSLPAPSGKPAKRPIHELSEEEQLQAALRASMNDTQSNESFSDEEDNVSVSENEPPPVKGKLEEKPSMEDKFRDVRVEEEPPANETNAVRVAFRMPNGKRVVRRFMKSDSIKVLYAFVFQEVSELGNGKSFTLKSGFPPKDLMDAIDSGTVESEGLAGGQILVSLQSED